LNPSPGFFDFNCERGREGKVIFHGEIDFSAPPPNQVFPKFWVETNVFEVSGAQLLSENYPVEYNFRPAPAIVDPTIQQGEVGDVVIGKESTLSIWSHSEVTVKDTVTVAWNGKIKNHGLLILEGSILNPPIKDGGDPPVVELQFFEGSKTGGKLLVSENASGPVKIEPDLVVPDKLGPSITVGRSQTLTVHNLKSRFLENGVYIIGDLAGEDILGVGTWIVQDMGSCQILNLPIIREISKNVIVELNMPHLTLVSFPISFFTKSLYVKLFGSWIQLTSARG